MSITKKKRNPYVDDDEWEKWKQEHGVTETSSQSSGSSSSPYVTDDEWEKWKNYQGVGDDPNYTGPTRESDGQAAYKKFMEDERARKAERDAKRKSRTAPSYSGTSNLMRGMTQIAGAAYNTADRAGMIDLQNMDDDSDMMDFYTTMFKEGQKYGNRDMQDYARKGYEQSYKSANGKWTSYKYKNEKFLQDETSKAEEKLKTESPENYASYYSQYKNRMADADKILNSFDENNYDERSLRAWRADNKAAAKDEQAALAGRAPGVTDIQGKHGRVRAQGAIENTINNVLGDTQRNVGAMQAAGMRARDLADETGLTNYRQAGSDFAMADYYAKRMDEASRSGNDAEAARAAAAYKQWYEKASSGMEMGDEANKAAMLKYRPAQYYGQTMDAVSVRGAMFKADNKVKELDAQIKDVAKKIQRRQQIYLESYGGDYVAYDENHIAEVDPYYVQFRDQLAELQKQRKAAYEQYAIYKSAYQYRQDLDESAYISDVLTNLQGADIAAEARQGYIKYNFDQKAAEDKKQEMFDAGELKISISSGRVGQEEQYRKYLKDATGLSYDLKNAKYMSQDELQTYFAIYNSSPEDASRYAAFVQKMNEEQHWAEIRESAGQNFGSRLGSLVAAPVLGLASGIDPYSEWGQEMSKLSEALQSGGAAGITKYGPFGISALSGEIDVPGLGKVSAGTFYNIGSSMIQSGLVLIPALAVGDGHAVAQKVAEMLGTAVMGRAAAASDYREKLAMGWREEDALLHANMTALWEASFEYISLDNLVDVASTKSTILRWLQQGGIEASEEACTTIANRISDGIIARQNGYDTSIEERMNELIANGMTYEEAEKQAEKEWRIELLNDAFAGFLSGFGNAAITQIPGAVQQKYQNLQQKKAVWEATTQASNESAAAKKYAADNQLDSSEFGDTSFDEGPMMDRILQDIQNKMSDSQTYEGAEQVYNEITEKYGEGLSGVADRAMYNASSQLATNNGAETVVEKILEKKENVNAIKNERAKKAANAGLAAGAYKAAFYEALEKKQKTFSEPMTMQATITNEDGSERQVGIESVDTEAGTVKLAGGETVSFDSLIADPDTKDVVHAMLASDMTEEASTKMIRTFQAQTAEGMVTDPYHWAMDYVTSYDRGRVGSFSLEKAQQSVDVLHADTVKIAYEAGQKASAQLTEAQRETLNNALAIREKGASGRAGSVDVGELAAKIEADEGLKAEVERIRKFAETFGIDVGLFESGVKNGRYQGENGRYQDGKIWLDINAGRNKVGDVARGMVQTMAHEMTHFMQEYSPEDYAGVKRFVMQQIAAQKGENAIKQLVAEKKKRHTGSKPLSTTMAEDEIVADFCEDMLTDKAALETMARENPKGFQALVEWVKDFLQKVKDKLAGRPAGSYEVQVYRSMEQSLRDAFGEAWGKGIVGAVQTHDIVGSLREAERLGASAQMAEEATMQQSDRLDEETLEFLDDQEHVTVYRAMQLIDGQLYPPMAAKVEGKLVDPTEIGKWYQSVERPDLVKNGKFTLNKGNGTSVPAAYNPYFHCSASPLNDQFSSAYKRPNLVVVEGIIPKSELTSDYKAEGAKNSVGETQWHAGPVASKLKGAKARRVFLSRYFQVTRIMSDAEVAGIVAKTLQGENVSIPSNVVTPSLLEALKAQGVDVDETGIERFEGQHKKKNAPEGAKKQDREFEYMKPFAEQVDDFMDIKNRKKIFGRDGLLVGTTPTIMQDIGLIKMPVGIDQKHVKYVVDQAYRKHSKHPEYQLDHVFDVSEFKKLPEKISDPVAIIADPKTKNLTVFVEMINMGGKQTIVPFAIHDELSFGGQRIELQRIETVHGDNEAENMLRGAILNDSDDRIRIYYANAKKIPQGIREAAQVRGRPIPDGIIHRITDEGSIVKPAFTSITETTQFKRWFGDSKIVDKNGAPKIMYRGDANRITAFDRSKARSGMYGRGFYFTDSESHARQYGEASQYYLSVQKPLQPGDHKITKQQMLDFLEAVAANEDDYSFENYGQNATVDKVLREIYGKGDFEMLQDVNATAIGDFVETVELFNRICGTKYDGIVAPTETVVFDSKQIKSATDNVGTFDRNNPDVRYQERDSFQGGANVEAVRDLIAVHNMTEQNLRDVLELGGFPSPSIAVVKAANGHTNYGPISVVFSRDSIDPVLDPRNHIYGADAWTPTARNSKTETEVHNNKRNALDNKLWELSKKVANGTFAESSVLTGRMGYNGSTEYSLEEILDRVATEPTVIAAYLADNGIEIQPVMKSKQFDSRGNDFLRKIIDGFGAQQLADIMSRAAQGESLTEEELAKVREIYAEDVANGYSPALKQRRGMDFLRQHAIEQAEKLGPWKLQEIVDHAWQLYESNGNDRSEIDYYPTLEAMKQAIDPEHRIDGLLEDKIKKTVGNWLRPQIKEIMGRKGIYNGKDIFTPSGNRRSFWQLHDVYTLENIVRNMNKASARGEHTYGMSAGTLQAVSAPEYKSISQVRADKGRLARVSDEDYKAQRKKIEDRIQEITERILNENEGTSVGSAFEDASIVGEVIIMAANGPRTVASVQRTFQRESDFKVSKESAKEILQLYKDAANLPTEYFEAKPQRAMYFDEVKAVVLPSNIDMELVRGLQSRGVDVRTFEPGNDAQRTEILNSLDDAKFQDRSYDAPSDMDLLDGFSQNDAENEEQRRLLREAQDSGKKLREAQRQLERLRADLQALAGDNPSRITIKDFRRNVLDLFGIPSSERNGDIGNMVQSVAENVLSGNKLTREDIGMFFQMFVQNGTMRTTPEEYVYAIRDDLKGRKIYVNEQVRKDLGDDYAALRKRAFGLGITLTGKDSNMSIDQHWSELAETYPGAFDPGETDLGTMLNQMINYAESGKASDVSILDGMLQVEEQTGEPVRDQLQRMYDSFVRHIEIMEDRGRLEAKARAGNAAEVVKAKNRAAKAQAELSKIRKERNEWKKKATSAEKKAADKLQTELRKIVKHDASQIAEAVRQKESLAKKLQQQVEREQKILSGKLNTPQLAKMLKTARETAAKEMAKHKDEVFARAKDRKRASELRSRIKNLSDEMKRRMTRPTDGAYVPASLYGSMTHLADVLDEVLAPNPGTKAAERYKAMLDGIRRMSSEYAAVADLDDPVYSTEYDEQIKADIDAIERTLTRNEQTWLDQLTGDTQKRLPELSTAELQHIYELMKSINYNMKNAATSLSWNEGKSLYEAMRDVAAQQQELTPLEETGKFETSKRSRLLRKMSTMRAVEMMAGYQRDAALYQLMHGIEQGVVDADSWVMNYDKAMQPLKNGKNELEYRKAISKKLDFGATTDRGTKVLMTKMQAIQILMTAEREAHNDKLVHLQKGGAVIRDKASGKSYTIQVTPELLSRIQDRMTEWDKAYMKTIRDYFGREGKATNEILYKLKHRVLQTEEYYVPYQVDKNYLETKLDTPEAAMSMWVKTPGSTNALAQKASQPVYIDGMDAVMGHHVREIANYIGLALAIRDFSKVYNGMLSQGDGENPLPVKETIFRNFGADGQRILTQAVIDIQGGRRGNQHRTGIGKFLEAMQSSFYKTALLINPSVTIKQAASYIAIESILDHRAVIAGNRPIFVKADKSRSPSLIAHLFAAPSGATAMRLYNEIDAHTSMHYIRRQGMSMRELASQANRSGPIARAKGMVGASMEQAGWIGHKARQAAEAISPLNWIQRMDVATTAAVWVACKEQAKIDGMKVGTDEYWNHVTELYERCLRETQPMYDDLHRNEYQKNQNGLIQYLFPFRTVPIQNHGQLANSYENLLAAHKSGDKARMKAANRFFRKTVAAQTMSAAVFSVMTFLAAALKRKTKKYRDDDEEISAETIGIGIGKDVIGTLISVISPMFGSEMWESANYVYDTVRTGKAGRTYDSFSVGVVDLLNELISKSTDVATDFFGVVAGNDVDKSKFRDHVMALLEAGAKCAGIPYTTVKTYSAGIRDNITDILEGRIPALNDEAADRTNAVNAKRFFEAVEDGDTEKADAVMEELRSNILEEKPGLESEDVDKKVQQTMNAYIKERYLAGDMTMDEATRYMIEYGGEEDENDAYWKIQEWEAKDEAEEGEKVTSSDYRNLYASIDANADINPAMKELTEHGYTEKDVRDAAKKYLVSQYEKGKITEQRLRGQLSQYCKIVKTDELNEIVKSANCYKETGVRLASLDDEYIEGNVSDDAAIGMLMKYKGKTRDDAKIQVRYWAVKRDNPGIEIDDSYVLSYYDGTKTANESGHESVERSGLSIKTYAEVKPALNKIEGTDYDGNGKNDTYTQEANRIAYIDKLNISDRQKRALYFEYYTANHFSGKNAIARPSWLIGY